MVAAKVRLASLVSALYLKVALSITRPSVDKVLTPPFLLSSGGYGGQQGFQQGGYGGGGYGGQGGYQQGGYGGGSGY